MNQDLGRHVVLMGHRTPEHRAIRSRHLHRVAIDERGQAALRHENVALAEVADDIAGIVQCARVRRQIRGDVHEVPPPVEGSQPRWQAQGGRVGVVAVGGSVTSCKWAL